MPARPLAGLGQPARVPPSIRTSASQSSGTTPSRLLRNASQGGRHAPFVVAGATTHATGMAQPR